MNEAAEVLLWGTRIGFLSHSGDAPFAEFSYDRDFIGAGIEPSPLMMRVSSATAPDLHGSDFLSKSNYFDTI